MARGSVFLIGGGWEETGFPHTYGRFAAAVGDDSAPIACILLDTDDRNAYFTGSVEAFAVGATVRSGAVSEGWAIDEDTMVELSAGRISVSGLGSAYHV